MSLHIATSIPEKYYTEPKISIAVNCNDSTSYVSILFVVSGVKGDFIDEKVVVYYKTHYNNLTNRYA